MTNGNHLTLYTSSKGDKIVKHDDIYSSQPSLHSSARANKYNKIQQEPARDNDGGAEKCRLCHPEYLDGKPKLEHLLGGKVVCFDNSAPYLPEEQKVFFLYHEDAIIRQKAFHKYKVEDLAKEEIFYFLSGAIIKGKEFRDKKARHCNPQTMIFGINLGKLAGQSIPHFHGQYGWDVEVNQKTDISLKTWELYYEELEKEHLVIYQDSKLRIISPWTPLTQYHYQVHFKEKYEITDLDEEDVKIIAQTMSTGIKSYSDKEGLGIQNFNIIIDNSPKGTEIKPVIVSLVPRTNTPALYELLKTTNVIDVFPQDVATYLKKIKWSGEMEKARDYSPEKELEARLK